MNSIKVFAETEEEENKGDCMMMMMMIASGVFRGRGVCRCEFSQSKANWYAACFFVQSVRRFGSVRLRRRGQ